MSIPVGHRFPYDIDPAFGIQEDGAAALVIPRRDIDRQDIQPLLAFTSPWLDDWGTMVQLGSSLDLVVDGYNADPRNLDQVPEVRAYFEAFAAAWPYLPYFLRPTEPCQMLYWMLVGGGRRSPDGDRRTLFGRGTTLKPQLQRFLEETQQMLADRNVVAGDPAMEPLDAACRAIADLLDTRSPEPFIRPVG